MGQSSSNSKSRSKSVSVPGAPSDTNQIRQVLLDFLSSDTTKESPFYGKMTSAYDTLLNKQKEGQPEASKAISEMITTGVPFTGQNYDEYKNILSPLYEQNLEKGLATAKESSGLTGTLRGSGGEYYMGKAAGEATTDFTKDILNYAMQAYDSAQNRKLAGVGANQAQQGIDVDTLNALVSGGTNIEENKYPLLLEAIAMATAGMGQFTRSTSNAASTSQSTSGGSGGGCCFTFIAGEGELTQLVRRYRDDHFGYFSHVGKGYRIMSKYLVPLMLTNKGFKFLIRIILTKPLTSYTNWYYGKKSIGFLFKPLAYFWPLVWSLISRFKLCLT